MASLSAHRPEIVRTLLRALQSGETTARAAQCAGIGRTTLHRWMQADPAFKEAVLDARVEGRLAWVHRVDALLEQAAQKRQADREQAEAIVHRLRAGDASALAELLPAWRELGCLLLGTHEPIYVNGRRLVRKIPRSQRPRCGARTRKGAPCQARPLPGKHRCKWHGGCSTGPKTEAGRERIRESNRRRAGETRPKRKPRPS
jgi:hypothetical protein